MNILKKGTSTIAAALFIGAAIVSLTYAVMRYNKHKPGVVIMIMGTSSSGKTSIVSELKKMYGSTYEIVDIDTFTQSYLSFHPEPEQLQAKELDEKTKNELGEDYNIKFVDGYYSLIRDKALKGNNILVDTVPVFDSDKEYELVSRILKNVKTIRVLLYCPLDVTIARVEKRNLTSIPGEHREAMQPISQYSLLYKPQESQSEQVLDSFSSTNMKHLLSSAISSFLKNLPHELKDRAAEITKGLESKNKKFVQQFKLDELNAVSIVSKSPYDLILSCKNTSKELAEEIVSFLKQQNINLVSNVMKLSQAQRAQFKKYAGKYKLHEDFIITITEESGRLFAQATGQEKLEIFPESETKFFCAILEAQISFVKDRTGKVINLILHQGGKNMVADKIE